MDRSPPGFAQAAVRHVWVVVDVDQNPRTAMLLGVFRVAATVVLWADGRILGSLSSPDITLEQVLGMP